MIETVDGIEGEWVTVAAPANEHEQWANGYWRLNYEYFNGKPIDTANKWEYFQPVVKVPTAPGVYIDRDNDTWVLDRYNNWITFDVYGNMITDDGSLPPEKYLPFTLVIDFATGPVTIPADTANDITF